MDYVSILDSFPLKEVGITILQTFILYWLLLIGLKLVGRRVFGEMGPQDLIVLLLIAEACDLGLTHEEAGFWGTVASVLTILAIGATVERIPPIRKLLEDTPVTLARQGKPDHQAMQKNLVEEDELKKVAREYGMADIEAFEAMTLEGDGSITGVLKPEYRTSKGAAKKGAEIT